MSSNKATRTLPWCIAAAMPGELAAVRRLRLPGVSFLTTGVGTRNAERAATRVLSGTPFRALIHIGFGGALSPSLAIGDILVANATCGVCKAPVDEELARHGNTTRIEGTQIRYGTFVTNDRVLSNAREKKEVATALQEGAIGCADMESAVVAKICSEKGIPYLGIRCITDTYDEDLPLDLNTCRGRNGNITTGRVMLALLKKPSILPTLIELRSRANICGANLARVVAAVIARESHLTPARNDVHKADHA